MIPKECKRLAEVDFPIAEVSRHAAREKSIRHGHPSTLHLWWARRPLASSRAVLLALLLPDPCDLNCPNAFKKSARESLLKMVAAPSGWTRMISTDEGLRRVLLNFIADFASWDRSADSDYIETARALVRAAHPEEPPLVVDPFAGGGSIPLEALRLGCDAFASDLNPVACLILKVMLEDIPRHGPGMVDELREAGERIKNEAKRKLASLYPPDSDGATPIAYLWARTVRCEAPECGAEIPLMRSFWLCRKPTRRMALRPSVIREDGASPRVDFEIFEPQAETDVTGGTVARARATCICCQSVLHPERVRAQLALQRGGADTIFDEHGNRRGGARMTAVVTLKPGERGRRYRLPTHADYAAVHAAQQQIAARLGEWERDGQQGLCPVPDEPLPPIGALGFRVQRYGMLQWGDLFTARQKVALLEWIEAIRKSNSNHWNCMSLVLGKLADLSNAICLWEPVAECPRQVLTQGRLKPAWDFGEGVTISDSSGGFSKCVDNFIAGVRSVGNLDRGQTLLSPAQESPLPEESASVWFTDPPYYDAVPYASLADFFFVWAKRIHLGSSLLRDPSGSDESANAKAARSDT